jgi:hypothetical protein
LYERDETPSPDPRSDDDVAGIVFLRLGCHLTLDQFIAFANMVIDCYLDHGMQSAKSINLLRKIMSLYSPNISNN